MFNVRCCAEYKLETLNKNDLNQEVEAVCDILMSNYILKCDIFT